MFDAQNIRDKAVLTTSYVAGTLIENVDPYNFLVLLVDFVKGSLTTAEIKIETASKLYYDLAYDGQSANFTVGKTVTGALSGATGVIVSDTDGGTTGTLVLKNIEGTFLDNEAISDDNSTPGAAVANGTLSVSSFTFHQQVASSTTTGTATETLVEHAIGADGKYRIPVTIKDRYVRISFKGTGTATGSLLGAEVELGIV